MDARDLLRLGWGQRHPAPPPTRCAVWGTLSRPSVPWSGASALPDGSTYQQADCWRVLGVTAERWGLCWRERWPSSREFQGLLVRSWQECADSAPRTPGPPGCPGRGLLALPARESMGLACPPRVPGRAGAGCGEGVGAGGGRPWPPGKLGVKGQAWGSACLWRPQASEPLGVLIAHPRCRSHRAL